MQSWALVTGATVGIGESFTRLLAKNGYNIVLVARDLPRLQERAKSLESTFGIATKVIQADLATDAGCKSIEDFITNNQIDVLTQRLNDCSAVLKAFQGFTTMIPTLQKLTGTDISSSIDDINTSLSTIQGQLTTIAAGLS